MAINALMKQNTEKINKIKLCLFSVEVSILLPVGINYLIRDNSIIIPALVIFVIAYGFFSIQVLISKKVSKKELQKETKTFKKKIVIGIVISLCSLIFSAIAKRNPWKILHWSANNDINILVYYRHSPGKCGCSNNTVKKSKTKGFYMKKGNASYYGAKYSRCRTRHRLLP